MTEDELAEMAKRHAVELGEHFDAVQIFCAKGDENNTDGLIIQEGRGLPCARYGMARAYVVMLDQKYRQSVSED